MRSVYPGQSWLIMSAGPRFNMAPQKRFTPFIFAEAGEARVETQHKRNVDWEPVAKAGFGFQARLTRYFGVTLVPAEWMGLRYDYNGSWDQSFTARIGLTFYLSGKTPAS
jgi:hemolysin activation/secretion protein